MTLSPEERFAAEKRASDIVRYATRGRMTQQNFRIYLGQQLLKMRKTAPNERIIRQAFLGWCKREGMQPASISADLKLEFAKSYIAGFKRAGEEMADYTEMRALALFAEIDVH